jgi:small subunit ribosomal protein S9
MDEQDKETSEQNETPEAPDEGTDAAAAGPVTGDDSPAHPPESSPPAPPAEDASEDVAEESAGEPAAAEPSAEAEEPNEDAPEEASEPEAAEEPVAEADEAEATEDSPADEPEAADEAPAEKPKAEKKKDVIPGADLEPIAVEPEAKPLSAEEQARLEAEEEERARREAELAAAEEAPATREPAKIEAGKRFIATGKRKRAIARVTIVPGDGKFEINKRSIEEFFPRPLHQTMARQPLAAAGYEGNVDVRVRVHGGGISGQAGAVRHGIARALTEVDSELRGDLKRRGFLTRDARVKERRKAGFKKARKKPQFSKR